MKKKKKIQMEKKNRIFEKIFKFFKKTMEDKDEKEEKVTDGKEEETYFYLLVLP